MTDGAFGIWSKKIVVPGNWNSSGTDLKVTVAVLYRCESAEAADGAKDHPRILSTAGPVVISSTVVPEDVSLNIL